MIAKNLPNLAIHTYCLLNTSGEITPLSEYFEPNDDISGLKRGFGFIGQILDTETRQWLQIVDDQTSPGRSPHIYVLSAEDLRRINDTASKLDAQDYASRRVAQKYGEPSPDDDEFTAFQKQEAIAAYAESLNRRKKNISEQLEVLTAVQEGKKNPAKPARFIDFSAPFRWTVDRAGIFTFEEAQQINSIMTTYKALKEHFAPTLSKVTLRSNDSDTQDITVQIRSASPSSSVTRKDLFDQLIENAETKCRLPENVIIQWSNELPLPDPGVRFALPSKITKPEKKPVRQRLHKRITSQLRHVRKPAPDLTM